MDIKKEHARIISKAEEIAGVAELMAVYKRLEESYRQCQPYLNYNTPVVSSSNTDHSVQL